MECPMSGYDIKKRVNYALKAIANASYGTLYPTLHRLLDEGAVEVNEVVQVGRPSKKIYRITEKGEAELRDWLKQSPASDQIRREFLLKLYLAHDLSATELGALMKARRDEVTHTLEALRDERAAAQTLQQVWVIDYAMQLSEAELEWIKGIQTQIAANTRVASPA